MPSPNEITVAQLSRLVGLPGAPVLADVRTEDEFNSSPQLIPTAYRHASTGVEVWCRRYAGQPIVVLCQSVKRLRRIDQERRRVDHALGRGDAGPRLEARSAA